MPRKPKTAATSPAEAGQVSGIAGTFPETLTGLQVATSLITDLIGDALAEANAAGIIAPDTDENAGRMIGYIVGASHCLIRASVAAGLAPESVLAELGEEVTEDAST